MSNSVRLRILSPGYAGFSAQYIDALLQLRRRCMERDIVFQWSGIQHLADIVAVRNEIARIFMEGDWTHLLMVDGDIGYDAADAMRMIERDVDFAAAAPPGRSLQLDHFKDAVRGGDAHPERRINRFYVEPLRESVETGQWTRDSHGFLRIESIGGAFLLLKRAVFEKLSEAHAGLTYKSVEGRPTVSYFEGEIVDGVRLGEDRMFCRRWRDLGGEIHLLPDCTMTHTGPFTFTGNFARFAGL